MSNIYDYPLSERKKRFDEIMESLPTDSPISAEAMIRELAILRKGYYDPHSWGFADEGEKITNLESEFEYVNAPICGNCKYFKPYGVMGFDGYSERCFNPKSDNCEVEFDYTCNHFDKGK